MNKHDKNHKGKRHQETGPTPPGIKRGNPAVYVLFVGGLVAVSILGILVCSGTIQHG